MMPTMVGNFTDNARGDWAQWGPEVIKRTLTYIGLYYLEVLFVYAGNVRTGA